MIDIYDDNDARRHAGQAPLNKITAEEILQADIDEQLSKLTEEYTAWNKKQGLDLGSADEHLFDESLTDEQREWLADFSNRWEMESPVYDNNGLFRRKDRE